MNFASAVVFTIIVILMIVAVRHLLKSGGGCSACSGCSGCSAGKEGGCAFHDDLDAKQKEIVSAAAGSKQGGVAAKPAASAKNA